MARRDISQEFLIGSGREPDGIRPGAASGTPHWFGPAPQHSSQAWRLSEAGEPHLPATHSCLHPSAAPAIARAAPPLRGAKPRCMLLPIEPDSQQSRFVAKIGSVSPKPREFGAYQPLQNCTVPYMAGNCGPGDCRSCGSMVNQMAAHGLNMTALAWRFGVLQSIPMILIGNVGVRTGTEYE